MPLKNRTRKKKEICTRKKKEIVPGKKKETAVHQRQFFFSNLATLHFTFFTTVTPSQQDERNSNTDTLPGVVGV
jgi:hypothetical protein